MSKSGKSASNTKEKNTPASFWKWFTANHKRFKHIENLAEDKAHEQLNQIVDQLKNYNPWFKALIGKYDDTTSELVITADGDIALFVKVEELISQAPQVKGWRFTAHKPPMGFDDISIEMFGKAFNEHTVKFYPLIEEAYPDMVSAVFTHKDYNEQEEDDFQTATAIYIQNALGELNTVLHLDHFETGPEPEDKSELIPVTKLGDYLNWREKEFVEKYDHATIESPEDTYHSIEGEDEEGNVMMAIAVTSLKDWPYKPVFPWWVGVQMEYTEAEHGLPGEETLRLLHDTEEKIVTLLTEKQDIVYVASKTYMGCRTAYFYAKNFKQPSLLMHKFAEEFDGELALGFFIEKDKYWQKVDEFYEVEETIDPEEEEE
ncbi:MAG: DUF695 domain-containing protein [Chitinophagaceae bacterium]|nr:DUF695 domain-containing protein [Chitinophagaceae bacterium]